MNDDEKRAMTELYEMVGEGKRLLMRWSATSRLSKEQKLQLRRDTKKHQRHSSGEIVRRLDW
jgi:hypothetical protein